MTRTRTICLTLMLAGLAAAAQGDEVEQALRAVRHVKEDFFSQESSVLGLLPGPTEMAAHQLRCRLIPKPMGGLSREIRFDAQTSARATELDPVVLRKAKGRMGLRILPLGITGAYVTEILEHRELIVVHVLADAPATGVLERDDIIIGANGRLFQDLEDPRPEMGHALVESQSPELGGILTLQVVREKKPFNVQVDLGNTLSYSATWPYDCEKSKQIRRAMLDFVMSRYPWHRYDFWTPLFLMASGDESALELARRHLLKGLKEEYPEASGAHTWRDSYQLISLCEYYLLTGDSAVLPAIRYHAQGLSWAQYRSGSWSHGGGQGLLAPGTASGGYGEINCAGLGAFVGLCLARKCGVEPYARTLPRSIRFFGEFCGSNFPYGLGTPSGRSGRMDNGMNSMAAIAFHLLGEEEMAERWARTVCYMWMGRERGHAEGIFSAAWGPLGAALAPKEEFHAFMNQMRWAYEMGRTRDGGITFMRGSRWTSPNMAAAMGLFLWMPERRLQILGGESVFAQRPPPGLERGAELYMRKQWNELRRFLTDYLEKARESTSDSGSDQLYARKLLAAHDRLEKQTAATVKIIQESINNGMLATAQMQLDLLAKMLGEERSEAARLRKSLDEIKIQDRRRVPLKPLIDEKELISKLELAKGGMGDGFAHSPGYIAQTNVRGFSGMSSERIAGFLGHFSGGAADGAARALAAHGNEVLPLVKRLLKDDHYGIRAGALNTLTHLYGSDSREYRTEVSEEVTAIIKLARPLVSDPSLLVRTAASGLVLSLKVLNEDVYEILRQLAKQGGNVVGNVVRHGIKDPAVRTELCMQLVDAANQCRSTVPAHYIPMVVATTAHLELCEPYIPTAVETLNNPEVLNMYGFFSNHPPNGALEILERYARNPLVLTNLTDVLRFAARKRGEMNSYWYPIVEFPHRIIVKIGPKALAVVDAFCESEEALYKRIQAAKEERPTWWKEDTVEHFDSWCREMRVTAELVRCLYGGTPPIDAIPSLCSIYLSSRPWGEWERQRIRDFMTEMSVEALPVLRLSLLARKTPLLDHLDRQAAARQTEAATEADRDKKRRAQKELEVIQSQKAELVERIAELEELASLMELFSQLQPTKAGVRTLCRFYVKRPWDNQYPFVTANCSYMRPLYEKQLALTRSCLQRWGQAALPIVRDFLEEDSHTLAKALGELDAEEEYWKPQWSRKSTMPLARIAQERDDIQRIRRELRDLADVITCAAQKVLSSEQLSVLCRVYSRNGWPAQRALIRDLLQASGAKALPVIRRHILSEKAALPGIVDAVEGTLSNSVKVRVKWRYDRARDQEANVRQGIDDLERIAQTLQ